MNLHGNTAEYKYTEKALRETLEKVGAQSRTQGLTEDRERQYTESLITLPKTKSIISINLAAGGINYCYNDIHNHIMTYIWLCEPTTALRLSLSKFAMASTQI